MKPFGLIKRIKYFIGKKDYHCHDKRHHKIGSWWEGYSEISSRSTVKRQIKKEIIQQEYE